MQNAMLKKALVLCALGSLVALAAVPHGARAASGSLYTAAQATSGKKLYAANCSKCHGADLSGVSAPALKGPAAPYHGSQSVAQVYDYISGQMPLNNPGGLPAKTYVSIMAYLLQQNGHSAGTTPLTIGKATTLDTVI